MTLEPVRNLFCSGSSGKILDSNWINISLQTIPHVTECAQHLDLSWIPAIFLLIFCPLVLYDLYRSENAPTRRYSPITYRIVREKLMVALLFVMKYTHLSILHAFIYDFVRKMICVVLVIDLTLSLAYNIFNYFILNRQSSLKYMVGDCAQYIGLCLALTLLIACRNRGIVTSGVLFNYWLLMVLCGFPELRFLLDHYWNAVSHDHIRLYLYAIYYPLVCMELFLSCFSDTPSGLLERNNGNFQNLTNQKKCFKKQVCPELFTSFLNQITFNWFTGLAIQGYKRPLEREDLWNLNERDKANNLIPDFNHFFRPQLDSEF
ncbi:hypothetical protein DICVIV_12934 [Dictyocaulus viviparus]|uniref:Uncharacterized protein n=1 Tax=Dictyocaulus viviparus TaxID=29172 RepID=A0A0D8X933_DICVI|nr:hypothetical protein DICVIV_12934 [Dictyocaulus viviparus]